MVIASSLNVRVREQEDREDDRYHVPSGEYQADSKTNMSLEKRDPCHFTYVNVSTISPMLRGS